MTDHRPSGTPRARWPLALTAAAIALGALGLIADPVGEDAAEALLGFAVIGGAILALSLVGRSW